MTKYLLPLIVLSAIFVACSPQRKMDKLFEKNPEIVAKTARDKFPCSEILKPETTTVTKDTTIYVDVECPPEVTTPADTVYLVTGPEFTPTPAPRIVRVPVKGQIVYTTIKVPYEDSSKIFLLTAEIERLKIANVALEAKNSVLRNDRKVLLWVLIATAALVIGFGIYWLKAKVFSKPKI